MIKFTPEDKFIVTGASSGLGQGVALLLNKLGATVIGIARNWERLTETKQKSFVLCYRTKLQKQC